MIKKKRHYRVCEHCGAALDPGEKCDCRDRRKGYDDTLGLHLLYEDKKCRCS